MISPIKAPTDDMQWLQELLEACGLFETLKKIVNMLDSFLTLLRVLFYLLAFLFFLMALPFIICHVAEHWDAPEYPYSGFTPDCPTWESTKDEFRRTK